MRRYPAIDILQIYANADTKRWNRWLTRRFDDRDIDGLMAMRYGLQAGMDDLVKKKLNTEKYIQFFLRLQSSVEKTIRKLLQQDDPNPCDNPIIAMDHMEAQPQKRARDGIINSIMKDTGY